MNVKLNAEQTKGNFRTGNFDPTYLQVEVMKVWGIRPESSPEQGAGFWFHSQITGKDIVSNKHLPVKSHHASLPVLQLSWWSHVIGLLPHLLALCQHLLDLIGPQGDNTLQTLHQLAVTGWEQRRKPFLRIMEETGDGTDVWSTVLPAAV